MIFKDVRVRGRREFGSLRVSQSSAVAPLDRVLHLEPGDIVCEEEPSGIGGQAGKTLMQLGGGGQCVMGCAILSDEEIDFCSGIDGLGIGMLQHGNQEVYREDDQCGFV